MAQLCIFCKFLLKFQIHLRKFHTNKLVFFQIYSQNKLMIRLQKTQGRKLEKIQQKKLLNLKKFLSLKIFAYIILGKNYLILPKNKKPKMLQEKKCTDMLI
ncbi:hypothetical protein IMG5_051010 [Ichthyophthirius multifiliis]|uniref:Uncharacterized protein n=1 Tax=Ichthyophthirius multifiliis TaxID=5932 RepID=G0QMP8_ICHMU|nr:hypothetical protein IMG5_051010 [Ichthyophthirius multifiliis]EGR33504.1 hypothetical protein IMG5_051010 [Ichthyophthirius multifiliis]|eukprot:XP_004037490.1 hypothetical protein IMG5_051010 [Ichthyophthirius multifiliis]